MGGTTREITARWRVEDALRASEERLRLATEAAGLCIWVWHVAEDRVVWENDRLYEIFGIDPAGEPVNVAHFLRDFIHPDDVKAFQSAIAGTLETGARYHFVGRFHRPSGELRWVEFTGLLDRTADGAPSRILGTAADVTERKLAEAGLRSSEERFRAVLETNAAPFTTMVAVRDESRAVVDFRRTYANAAAASLTGEPLADMIGASIKDERPGVEGTELYAKWLHTLDTGRPFVHEFAMEFPRGPVYLRMSGVRLEDGIASSFTDLTERQRNEERLEEASPSAHGSCGTR